MLKIGITGSIGSGKTTVANLFANMGIPVYVSDRESKKFIDKNKVKKQIVEKFGIHLVDINGNIDKSILAGIVFSDKQKLKELEDILHPLVQDHFENWCQQFANFDYILYESAIIFESNSAKDFDYIIAVSAPEDIRVERVMKRSNLTKDDVLNVMNNQMSDSEKVKLADFVIVNSGYIGDLDPQVVEIDIKLRELM